MQIAVCRGLVHRSGHHCVWAWCRKSRTLKPARDSQRKNSIQSVFCVPGGLSYLYASVLETTSESNQILGAQLFDSIAEKRKRTMQMHSLVKLSANVLPVPTQLVQRELSFDGGGGVHRIWVLGLW